MNVRSASNVSVARPLLVAAVLALRRARSRRRGQGPAATVSKRVHRRPRRTRRSSRMPRRSEQVRRSSKKRGAAFKSAPPPRESRSAAGRLEAGRTRRAREVRAARHAQEPARRRALAPCSSPRSRASSASTGARRRTSPDRPQLARRLAEGYVELESRGVPRQDREADIKARRRQEDERRRRPASSRRRPARPTQIMKAARKKAIDVLHASSKNDYPNYSQLDEVLYYLAYEYEQASDLKNARKVYFELIQKAPQVEVHPERVPRVRRALLQRSAGRSVEVGSRRAGVHGGHQVPAAEQQGLRLRALQARLRLLEQGRASPQALERVQEDDRVRRRSTRSCPNAAQLAEVRAPRHHPGLRASAGDPEQGVQLLQAALGRQAAASTSKTFKMMDDLGIELPRHRSLPGRHRPLQGPDGPRHAATEICVYQAHITEATLAMKSGNKDVDRQGARQPARGPQRVHRATSYPADAEARVREHAPPSSSPRRRWLAPRGRRLAAACAAPATRRRWRSPPTSTRRSSTTSRSEEFAKFEFPRIVKEDWPTIYKIKYAMADLLYFQKHWAKCGPAFDSVVAENPKGAEAPEAAYASVLCYQKMYDQMHKGDVGQEGQGPRSDGRRREGPRGQEGRVGEVQAQGASPTKQKGMITAFNRYVCYIKPADGRQGSAGAVRRGEVRARAHLLRGAALGGGGARLPRRRA